MSEVKDRFEQYTPSAPISWFVAQYARLCSEAGYVPLKNRKGQLGRTVERLIKAGTPPRDIYDAIRILADERKSPGVLDLVVTDVQGYGVAR